MTQACAAVLHNFVMYYYEVQGVSKKSRPFQIQISHNLLY